MTNILEYIPYSDQQDLERYVCWFSSLIQAGVLKCSKNFRPLLKSDVNAEQQQLLWEQGRSALEKVTLLFLCIQY